MQLYLQPALLKFSTDVKCTEKLQITGFEHYRVKPGRMDLMMEYFVI